MGMRQAPAGQAVQRLKPSLSYIESNACQPESNILESVIALFRGLAFTPWKFIASPAMCRRCDGLFAIRGTMSEKQTGGTTGSETVVVALEGAGRNGEEQRGEISVGTVARLMGLATTSELKLMEGKVDLVTAKINAVTVKLEKAITMLNGMATGADLERVDVQIGALRQMIREFLGADAGKAKKSEGGEAVKKPGTNIQSNS
jgi:hypothetical protein